MKSLLVHDMHQGKFKDKSGSLCWQWHEILEKKRKKERSRVKEKERTRVNKKEQKKKDAEWMRKKER